MTFTPQPPYDYYDSAFEFFQKDKQRWFVSLRKADEVFRTSRARYRLSVKLRYIVPQEFEVDHEDEDKLNDEVNNLQLLTKTQNVQKHYEVKRGGTPIEETYNCTHCGKPFTLNHGEANSRKASTKSGNLFCSKSCSTIHSGANLLSPERITKINEMRAEGKKLTEIASTLGMSNTTVAKYQDPKYDRNPPTPEKVAEITKLLKENLSYKEIGKALKIDWKLIPKYLK